MRKITKYLIILLIIITTIFIIYLGYNQLQQPQVEQSQNDENELLQSAKGNSDNIVQQVMLELTDNKYAGRINGTEGNLLATLYLAETFDSIGLRDVSYMFNLADTMGERSKVLNQELSVVFSKHGIPHIEHTFGIMSDNRSFLINGIPSVPITQDVEIIKEIFHTEKDILDIIDIDNIEKVADSITEFVIISKGKMY